MMKHLDHYDKEIIHFLGHRGKSTTNEIADENMISWTTAKEHLDKLKKMGYVKISGTEKTKVYWEINK